MRVPQSPRTLHRIMSVVSDDDSTNSDSDGANAMNGSEALSSGCHFKKSKRAQEVSSTSRPPRPTYTTKFKDGKYTVGVEAPLLVTKDLPATEQQESSGLHRSRERTRLSAVQRLVERRLAQKEKDRLKERDQERDLRLASLGSSSRSSSFSSLARDRSWERSKLTGSNGSTSAECAPASAPWRARSCSATRFCTNSSEEDVAKTYISIGPGRPTRIREHSPSKKSPTVEQLPSDFSDDADVRAAKTQNTSFKSSRSSSALRTSSPLKSTGLFREFSSPSLASLGGSGCKSVGSDMGQVGSDKVRKSSFTTEKTFTVNTSSYRKVSLDCNYVYERSPPTVSSFSQADKMTANINPNSSSSFSSSSSSSASSMTSSLSSESLDDQPGDLPKGFTSQVPLRQRKSSSRMFTTTPLPSLNGSSNQDSESGCDTSSCRSSLSSNDSFSGGSGYFSSASSRLLYNLSSGYRFHRAAAAAAGVHSEVQENGDDIVTAANQINNLNNKIKVEDAYPRRRFSQEHVDSVQEQQGAVHLESLPSRKISLPVRPSRDMYHRETKSLADQKKEEGNELYKIRNYREALQRYSEAISLCPVNPSFYGNRAACYMMLAQHSRALDDARFSVSLDANFIKGYIRMAKCCFVTGDLSSARQALDKAKAIEPNNSAVQQEQTNLQRLQKLLEDVNQAKESGDHRKTLYYVNCAIEMATACRSLKILKAECLALLGRYAEAQEIANDLLRQDSTNVDAIYVRGLCLYYEDNVDKAFTHFQQVLRLAPDHSKAQDTYKKAKLLRQKKEEGNVAFKNHQLVQAYDLYSQALSIDPLNKFTNAKLYLNRAIVAAKMKKLKESVEDCSKALELDDKYLKALLRRAKSYMELEMFEEAVRDYEQALKSDRSNNEYRQLLQHAKLELKKSKRKDYYKILGIDRGASDDEIKKAYRKRALVHHPDRHSSASEHERKEHERKFKEVGEAYNVLSDAQKRSRYDNGYDVDDLDGHAGAGFGANIDPNQIFQSFFFNMSGGGAGGAGGVGGAGGAGGGPHHAHSHNFSFDSSDSFFRFG